MKVKKFFIFSALFLAGLSLAPVRPAEAIIETCPGDYYSFILTARSAATRKQTISDFFTLGYCQLNDVMKLEDQLDGVRDAFRDAANTCDDTTQYEVQYNEILMEEYFVRNIQKSKSDVINEKDEEKFKELKEARLVALKEEMEALFVEKEQRVDEDTFEIYFSNWSSQYDDRIGNYAHCEEGAWAELQDTWKKFIDDINAISIDVEKQEFSFDSDVNVDADVDPSLGENAKAIGKTFQNAYEYLKMMKETRQAQEVDSKTTAKDVGHSGSSMSFEEALNTLNSSDTTFVLQTNSANRMAGYELLYGSGGAVAATDMQSILTYMNQVLASTNTEDFPNITKSSSQVYDKQCQ